MTLVPATAALVRAEIEDRPAFANQLGAAVPDAWPPDTLRDALAFFLGQLEAAPEQVGWGAWYGIADGAGGEKPALVASCGFFGPPQGGSVEIGYSVLPEFQRRGYGGEMAGALTEWALAKEGVGRVVANVASENIPSTRLLRRLGFVERGMSDEPGHVRFEKAIV